MVQGKCLAGGAIIHLYTHTTTCRGSRGRGRGKGGGTGDTTTVDCQEDVLILPNAKRARLSLDLIAEKEKSARGILVTYHVHVYEYL